MVQALGRPEPAVRQPDPRPPLVPELLARQGRPARIALVHDWFQAYYGSERVVGEILQCFPDADLFAVVDIMPEDQRGFLGGRPVRTSFIQKLPGARTRFRTYLPLMPLAIEQFDLSGYDLVLTSSHAVAKGVLTGPNQLHVAYVHAPMRYAWEYQHEYLRGSRLERGLRSWITRYLLHRLRLWDSRTGAGVDRFIANSTFIARRIEKIYRRESLVIHPPVAVESFPPRAEKEDFFLAVSRFVPYKHTETIVEAFALMRDRKLVVIGDGPGFARAKAAASPNVTLLGRQPFDLLRDHMQRAQAFVFAAEEDFGITPVEAQAAGTPVIAYGAGGALETVIPLGEPEPTGLFFDAQTPQSIAAAVDAFVRNRGAFSADACRAQALRFGPERFRADYTRAVIEAWRAFGGSLSASTLAALTRAAVAGT